MTTINDIKVAFEDAWLEEYEFQHIVISPNSPSVGAIVATVLSEYIFKVKVFQLQLNEVANNYHITQEVAALEFQTEADQIMFINMLPELSAIDLLFYIRTESVVECFF